MSDPALVPAWRALQDRGAVDSAFGTWQWASALADVPEVSADMRVLLASDGSEPVGLLALERVSGPGSIRAITVAGSRWLAPDHVDVIALPEQRAAVATAIVVRLARATSWDLLDLDGLRLGGGLECALRALRPPRYLTRLPEAVDCLYVSLGGSANLRALPGRSLRQQVTGGLRAVEHAGGSFTVVTEPEAVVHLVERLMDLHNARFGERSVVYASPGRRRFHLLAARRLAEDGLARVYRLSVPAGEAGLLYAFWFDGRLAYYSMGIDPELARSPGWTVLGSAILSAAREGAAEFDLLRGAHEYKQRFATGSRRDVRCQVVKVTTRTALQAARRVPRWAGRWAARHAFRRGAGAFRDGYRARVNVRRPTGAQ